jgi:hypothetical protein
MKIIFVPARIIEISIYLIKATIWVNETAVYVPKPGYDAIGASLNFIILQLYS